MKNKRKNSSLFALLTRYNLMFMLVLLLVAAGVYGIWTLRIESLIGEPKIDILLKNEALYNGEYNKIPIYRLLGNQGAISVFDENGAAVYRSSKDPGMELTLGELNCVSDYNSNSYAAALEYIAENNKKHYFVTFNNFTEDDSSDVRSVMILDERLNIISGSMDKNRDSYTKREFEFLTGSLPENYDFFRHTFKDADGKKRILLIRTAKWSEKYYNEANNVAARTWFLIIPLFIIAAAGFVVWLNQKIKKPLERLDQAIVGLGRDNANESNNCGGPLEIQKIEERFSHMARQLKQSEQERKRLDEGRQKLIADISHDLKTPITVISGYTKAICDQKIPQEKIHDYLKVIDDKATSLTELIDTFYEYSKVEHPEFSLNCQRMELCEFLRKYLSEKYDEINLAGFSLDVVIPEAKLYCDLDYLQFRRALDNIISNALRHNRLGTILFFNLLLLKSRVLIRIGDNGRGIPLSMGEKIFEPFTVGDTSRSSGGSGLGLSIAKYIIQEHGGSIKLVAPSTSERNTEFEIELPLSKS